MKGDCFKLRRHGISSNISLRNSLWITLMPVLKNLKDPSKSHKGRSGAFLKKKPFLGGGRKSRFPKNNEIEKLSSEKFIFLKQNVL